MAFPTAFLLFFFKIIKFKASIQYYCFSLVGFVVFFLVLFGLIEASKNSIIHTGYGWDIGGFDYFMVLFLLPLLVPALTMPHVTINYFLSKNNQRTGIWSLLKPLFVVTLGIAIILAVSQFTK